MSIKNKLYFGVFIAIFSLVIFVFGLLILNKEVNARDQRHLVLVETEIALSDLNQLTYKYLAYPREENNIKWNLKYWSTLNLINKVAKNEGNEDILNKFKLLRPVFLNIVSQKTLDSERDEVLISGFLKEFESIKHDIKILSKDVLQSSRDIRETFQSMIFYVFITALFLIIYISIKLFAGIKESLDSLIFGIKQVKGGNKNYVVRIKGDDEFVEVAEYFNEMTKNLNESDKKYKEFIKELEYKKNKLQVILRSIEDAVIFCDRNKKIVLFNKSAEKMTGFSENEAVGKNHEEILKIVTEKRDKSSIDYFKKTIKTNKVSKLKNGYYVVGKKGEKTPIAQTISPVLDFKGKIIGCVNVLHDITKDKEVMKAKTEFISTASHQLRTPASTIKLLIDAILKGYSGKITKKQKEYINNLKNASDRLITLVNDLLNVSRIESDKLSINIEKVDPRSFIKEIINETKFLDMVQNCSIRLKRSETALPPVFIDKILIRQAFRNILDNAVHYSQNGKLCKIIVALKSDPKGILISISDNGIGIDKKDQSKVFTRFFRSEKAVRVFADGTGLGLYVAKGILERLGGKIWFESEPGKGTTFYVLLPKRKKEVVSPK